MAHPRPGRWFDAARFANLRRARQVSQTEVATMLGVQQATVSRWERGERQPTREQAQTLATMLGVDTLTR